MYKTKRAKRLSQALRASLFTDHMMSSQQCVPNTDISGRFESRLLTFLPPIPILPYWTRGRQDMVLLNRSVCSFAIPSNAVLPMSFHVVRPRSNVCTTFPLPLQRFAIRTFFCIRQPNHRCIPSTRDQETTWAPPDQHVSSVSSTSDRDVASFQTN